jgi:MoaA/NifB/PqqE/SkfB family radical SAM enzyme
MNLTFLYRGPLKSCNFGCGYCPFAKSRASAEERQADRQALYRLAHWLENTPEHTFSLFFTPWGEALIWPVYQETLVRLSRLDHIHKIAIQTNLSGDLGWLSQARQEKIDLWCTFHPGEMAQEDFLSQVQILVDRDVRFSVGIVGVKAHVSIIHSLREVLPENVYLWVNADKHQSEDYTPEELRLIRKVDPLFEFNRHHYKTLGHACRCGETVFSLQGDGTLQRCHFIPSPVGNIYEPGWEKALRPAPCSAPTCHCHIGYVHMPEVGLAPVFGDGILARIPAAYPLRHCPPFPEHLI